MVSERQKQEIASAAKTCRPYGMWSVNARYSAAGEKHC